MDDEPYERIHWHLSEAIIALCDYTDQHADTTAMIEIARMLMDVQQRVMMLQRTAHPDPNADWRQADPPSNADKQVSNHCDALGGASDHQD